MMWALHGECPTRSARDRRLVRALATRDGGGRTDLGTISIHHPALTGAQAIAQGIGTVQSAIRSDEKSVSVPARAEAPRW
jgi:hypothetical protein